MLNGMERRAADLNKEHHLLTFAAVGVVMVEVEVEVSVRVAELVRKKWES